MRYYGYIILSCYRIRYFVICYLPLCLSKLECLSVFYYNPPDQIKSLASISLCKLSGKFLFYQILIVCYLNGCNEMKASDIGTWLIYYRITVSD